MDSNVNGRQQGGSRYPPPWLILSFVAAFAVVAGIAVFLPRNPAPPQPQRTELRRIAVDWGGRARMIESPTIYNDPADVEFDAKEHLDAVEQHLGAFGNRPVVLIVDTPGDSSESAPGYSARLKKIVVPRLVYRLRLADFVEARVAEIRGGPVPPYLRDGLVFAMRGEQAGVDWEKESERTSFVKVMALHRLDGMRLRDIAELDAGAFPGDAETERKLRVFNRLVTEPTYRSRSAHWVQQLFRVPPLPSWLHYDEAAFDWRNHIEDAPYSAASLVFDHWYLKDPARKASRVRITDLPPIELAWKQLLEEDLIQLLAILGTEQLLQSPGLVLKDVEIEKAEKLGILSRGDAVKGPGPALLKRAKATGALIAYALHTSGYSLNEITYWSSQRWYRRGKYRAAPEGREPIEVIRMSPDQRLRKLKG